MKKTLYEVLSITECKKLSLQAGHKGLSRVVEWTDVIETADRIAFSIPNQLVFVTGIHLRTEKELLELISKAADYQQSGVVISVGGPYWQKLPESVLEFGDENDFPVFILTWEEKLSKYTHAIGQYLLSDVAQKYSVNSVLRQVFSGEMILQNNSEALAVIEELGLLNRKKYQIGVWKILKSQTNSEKQLNQAKEELINKVREIEKITQLVVPMGYGAVSIMWKNSTSQMIDEYILLELKEFSIKLEKKYGGIKIKCGLSTVFSDIENMGKEYRKACTVTQLIGPEMQKEKMLYQYSQLGAFQMIADCMGKDYMKEFQKENYEPLLLYDQINNTDLCTFLENYFRCNCNVKKVSETIYLHKNTVLYKLKKIEGILNCDFNNIEDLFNIRLALLIKDISGEEI